MDDLGPILRQKGAVTQGVTQGVRTALRAGAGAGGIRGRPVFVIMPEHGKCSLMITFYLYRLVLGATGSF